MYLCIFSSLSFYAKGNFRKQILNVTLKTLATMITLLTFVHCDRYMPQIMRDGVSNQQSNPEVEVDVTKPNSVVNMQIMRLKIIINKLTHAYNGLDVDWIDTSTYS